MSKKRLVIFTTLLAVGAGNLAIAPSAYAFNMGDMMKPNKWFGGDKDRWDDDYYYDRYGPYGGPYGYGPYGGGWGGPYGWGGGPYGYGYPGYGMPYQQQQQSSEPPPPPLPQ